MQAPRQILQGFNFLIPNGLLLKQAWLTTVIKVNLAMKRLLVQHILVAKKKKTKTQTTLLLLPWHSQKFLGKRSHSRSPPSTPEAERET